MAAFGSLRFPDPLDGPWSLSWEALPPPVRGPARWVAVRVRLSRGGPSPGPFSRDYCAAGGPAEGLPPLAPAVAARDALSAAAPLSVPMPSAPAVEALLAEGLRAGMMEHVRRAVRGVPSLAPEDVLAAAGEVWCRDVTES